MPHAPTDVLERRHASIRASLRAAGLDAAIIVSLPNITWLTNFAGSSAIVVLDQEQLTFITDSRYVTTVNDMQAASHACPSLTLTSVDGSYDATLAGVIRRGGYARVGFEASHLTVSRYRWLEQTLGSSPDSPGLVAMDNALEVARSVKDAYEVALFRTAGEMLVAPMR